ncbi:MULTISPECIES: amino acid ABC transporter permease [Paenibacillus]|uniref:Arginine ABC transporter permease n=1 Tax=Paenibacillus naphthalenovorans TaxID=162209 RepID=A0A0U2U7K4_9BACL|nr:MULTISPECIES: amino acid ABC transporter permease [Paenibacillus]ALS22345.1 arginine ABC transporter permease [Paenibacillus naphthalenovorans]GCL70138.1 amino acid ABC transporter permease [Paenibacillus naphthalenovorans]SDJ56147.1 polar amino acid transport system permease protein [Paenibacillus naphthalenovorans]
MDFSFLPTYYMFFINGAKMTLILSFFTVIFGVILGIGLALMRMSRIYPLKIFSVSYIEFIRGTPLLVQVLLFYYGLPKLGIKFPELPWLGSAFPDVAACILALSFNSAAYVAETFRAGIQAIDKGQMEAARSLGMPHAMAMRYIILPQAFRNVLPALGNEFITIIKDSSIVSVIGVAELMYSADTVKGNTFQPFEPLIVVSIVYFMMTFVLSKLLGLAERRLRTSD